MGCLCTGDCFDTQLLCVWRQLFPDIIIIIFTNSYIKKQQIDTNLELDHDCMLLARVLVRRAEVGDLSKHPTRLWNMKTAKSYDTRRNHSLTFSQAKRTGAVARPSLRSAAAGLPIVSDDDTKSKRSSTNWKARPRFLPYWKAVSTSGASAPDIVAACGDKSSLVSGVCTNLSTYSL